MSPTARLRTSLVLTTLLFLTGVFNVLPWTHPSGEERKKAVASHLSDRAEWFRRQASDDLAFLAQSHGSTTQRYAPYLWIRKHLDAETLTTYPASLVDPDDFAGKLLEEQPDGQPPVEFIERGRTLGLATVALRVCRYEPRLPEDVRERLLDHPDFQNEWETGHRYTIVSGPAEASERARVMVSGDDLFFVSDDAFTAIGFDPGEPDC